MGYELKKRVERNEEKIKKLEKKYQKSIEKHSESHSKKQGLPVRNEAVQACKKEGPKELSGFQS